MTLRFADAGDVTVPVAAGALTISLASTIPTPAPHATPASGTPMAG